MPEHKMVTINGIRYRREDLPEGHTPPGPRTLTTRVGPPPAEPKVFDPSAHTVDLTAKEDGSNGDPSGAAG